MSNLLDRMFRWWIANSERNLRLRQKNLELFRARFQRVQTLHQFFIYELIIVGLILIFYPQYALKVFGLSYGNEYSQPQRIIGRNGKQTIQYKKTRYQFIRLVGVLCLCMAVHYSYESGTIRGLKSASMGRILLGILVIGLTYEKYFDKIFYLFALQDGLTGIYAAFETTRLQYAAWHFAFRPGAVKMG